jgi:hypothetical protein
MSTQSVLECQRRHERIEILYNPFNIPGKWVIIAYATPIIRPVIVGRWFEEPLGLVGFAYTKP